MKRCKMIMMNMMLLISIYSVSAQDKPVGFASIRGNGLETTTGGEGGKAVLVENLADLKRYASSDEPYIIIVKGIIQTDVWTEVHVSSNKTIAGYDTDAILKNVELKLIDVQNIIIRNLTIRDSYVEGDWEGKTNDNDAIQADNSHHIWIDHCFFTHCGDGLIDLRKACDYVTVSWVHFSNNNKTFGIGWTDETDWKVTIHHCWFDNTVERNPSFDQGIGHLFNNFVSDNQEGYGNLTRGHARLVIENSVFSNVNDPLDDMEPGKMYATGNVFENCTGNQAGNMSERPFNPTTYYNYKLDSVKHVKSIVTAGAGPQNDISGPYLAELAENRLTITVDEEIE